MVRALSSCGGNLRQLAGAAFGLAVLACVLGPTSAARAGDGLVHLASTDDSVFDQTFDRAAVSDRELSRQRGDGLDAQAPSSPAKANGIAVILWDEATPPRGSSTTPRPAGAGGSAGVSTSVGATGGSSAVSSNTLYQITTNNVITGGSANAGQ